MCNWTWIHTCFGEICHTDTSVAVTVFSGFLAGCAMELDGSSLCFRGESLDNLDSPRTNSWRQSPWLNQPSGVYASSSVQDFSRPPPQLLSTSNRAYMRSPSSSIPPPSAGSVKTTSPSPTPRGHPPAAPQPGSQPRSRSGPLRFPSSFLSLRGCFCVKNCPRSCPSFPVKKKNLFECIIFSVPLPNQFRRLP